MTPQVSVVLPTHNPHRGRLARTLAALAAQTLPPSPGEILVVDNASSPALDPAEIRVLVPRNFRLVHEPQLGLTTARRRGFTEARGEFIVLVDDDNVLAPDYLARVLEIFAHDPHLGAIGGKSLPEFEAAPPAWVREFDGQLACRDLGDTVQICHSIRDARTGRHEYPLCAPLGAGMALRRSALTTWLDEPASAHVSDRRGGELTSGGDNDIALTLARHGWALGYFPKLVLTHLIPAARIQRDYLARLNRGIAKSWMQVLAKHDANPWPPIAPATVRLRQLKAWFTHRAWSSPAAYVRWQGACGHFEGRAALIDR